MTNISSEDALDSALIRLQNLDDAPCRTSTQTIENSNNQVLIDDAATTQTSKARKSECLAIAVDTQKTNTNEVKLAPIVTSSIKVCTSPPIVLDSGNNDKTTQGTPAIIGTGNKKCDEERFDRNKRQKRANQLMQRFIQKTKENGSSSRQVRTTSGKTEEAMTNISSEDALDSALIRPQNLDDAPCRTSTQTIENSNNQVLIDDAATTQTSKARKSECLAIAVDTQKTNTNEVELAPIVTSSIKVSTSPPIVLDSGNKDKTTQGTPAIIDTGNKKCDEERFDRNKRQKRANQLMQRFIQKTKENGSSSRQVRTTSGKTEEAMTNISSEDALDSVLIRPQNLDDAPCRTSTQTIENSNNQVLIDAATTQTSRVRKSECLAIAVDTQKTNTNEVELAPNVTSSIKVSTSPPIVLDSGNKDKTAQKPQGKPAIINMDDKNYDEERVDRNKRQKLAHQLVQRFIQKTKQYENGSSNLRVQATGYKAQNANIATKDALHSAIVQPGVLDVAPYRTATQTIEKLNNQVSVSNAATTQTTKTLKFRSLAIAEDIQKTSSDTDEMELAANVSSSIKVSTSTPIVQESGNKDKTAQGTPDSGNKKCDEERFDRNKRQKRANQLMQRFIQKTKENGSSSHQVRTTSGKTEEAMTNISSEDALDSALIRPQNLDDAPCRTSMQTIKNLNNQVLIDDAATTQISRVRKSECLAIAVDTQKTNTNEVELAPIITSSIKVSTSSPHRIGFWE